MKTLISMTDFVLDKQEKYNYDRFYYSQFKDTVVNYARFLKQPLKLEMFVPCDDEGNVLDEPDYGYIGTPRMIQYEKAKEKVLFEGFEYIETDQNFYVFNEKQLIRLDQSHFFGTVNIEFISSKNVELTPTALKQIGI